MEKIDKKQLELAGQQFVGYTHAKKGYGLIDLVESMGLTKEEWVKLEKIEAPLFTKSELDEINLHFEIYL